MEGDDEEYMNFMARRSSFITNNLLCAINIWFERTFINWSFLLLFLLFVVLFCLSFSRKSICEQEYLYQLSLSNTHISNYRIKKMKSDKLMVMMLWKLVHQCTQRHCLHQAPIWNLFVLDSQADHHYTWVTSDPLDLPWLKIIKKLIMQKIIII